MVKKEEVVTEIKTVTRKVIPKKKTSKKKFVQKKPVRKKAVVKNTNTLRDVKTEKILIDNFVSLQRIMVDMSSKFGALTKQISELLNLFEDSAKTLVKRDFEVEKNEKPSEELLVRMDKLIDQNRTISKGLVLMHEHSTNMKNSVKEPQGNYSPSILSGQTQPPLPPNRKLQEIQSFRKPPVKEEVRDDEPEIPKGF